MADLSRIHVGNREILFGADGSHLATATIRDDGTVIWITTVAVEHMTDAEYAALRAAYDMVYTPHVIAG